MKNIHNILSFIAIALSVLACGQDSVKVVSDQIGAAVLERAETDVDAAVSTVTDFVCDKSAGGPHDFFSQADYFWPDPENPAGPYVRKDGMSNPENFEEHRHAMVRMASIVGELTSAWRMTGDARYAQAAQRHLMAWFVDEQTCMAPHLCYGQAIIGRCTGRSIGVIDTIHLIEVAQSLILLEQGSAVSRECIEGCRKWFSEYLRWLLEHPFGIKEMNEKNNHGTCWAVQAAAFAKFTGDDKTLDMCRDRFKNVFLPQQMGPDGSFPLETRRTKPYGYSLFNLDAMATLCAILSTADDDLWTYETEDGQSMLKGLAFMTPYVMDKSSWPFPADVMCWDEWPVAQPFLILAWDRFRSDRNVDAEQWLQTWKGLEHFPTHPEVRRNLPVRNPLLWL